MYDTLKLICEKKPLMVAHRGLSGLEKENTHAAFAAAGNRSYEGMETDIHRTSDGRYVCIHDATTARVGIDNINVEECTFDTVRGIKLCGRSGVKDRADICIPSLEEYIGICRRYDKDAVTELKGQFTKEQIIEICEIIATEGWLHRTIFIAFDLQNLIYLREYLPKQAAQFLFGGDTEGLPEILNKYDLDLDIYFGSLTPELCERVHADGHLINVWTVDSLEDAQKLAEMGVDYITSNIIE
ncbi:MAG: hypothetical protein IKZ19_09265 [Clostridia bacterium]|nr:hypothetical protein [Clostridia bacterium]